MEEHQDYIKDIAEIRSMMERSSKFLSLSGWAGILAGVYALVGVWISYSVFEFNPTELFYAHEQLHQVVLLATGIFVLALVTAIFFSKRKANSKEETIWNSTSKRLLANMAVPALTGGLLVVIIVSEGLLGLAAPMLLIFYGLSLFVAGNFTINEVKFLGIIQLFLGLINLLFIEYGLIFWGIGFGVFHIIYGMYMHFRYER
ncbi:MAG: hypothetical protein BalsKO_19870 [Balneolaceae bacterium]